MSVEGVRALPSENVEDVEKDLPNETAALMGEFLGQILLGKHVLSSLVSKVPELKSKEEKNAYTATLLLVCAAALRNEIPMMKDIQKAADMKHVTTVSNYAAIGVKSGHLTQEVDPRDSRAILLKPSKRLLSAFKKDMNTFARVTSKIQNLSGEDAKSVREESSK